MKKLILITGLLNFLLLPCYAQIQHGSMRIDTTMRYFLHYTKQNDLILREGEDFKCLNDSLILNNSFIDPGTSSINHYLKKYHNGSFYVYHLIDSNMPLSQYLFPLNIYKTDSSGGNKILNK